MHDNGVVARLRGKAFALLVGIDELDAEELGLLEGIETEILSKLAKLLNALPLH
jgi:hypothetical protein